MAAIKIPGHPLQWHFAPATSGIVQAAHPNACILVDMILGLPDATRPGRLCDALARQQITPHGARVFSAPPREALYACTTEACARPAKPPAKLFQTDLHLLPKIRELDAVAYDWRLREAHPELVFARFNKNCPVAASKNSGRPKATLGTSRVRPSGSKEALELADRHLLRNRQQTTASTPPPSVPLPTEQLTRLPPDARQPGIWY